VWTDCQRTAILASGLMIFCALITEALLTRPFNELTCFPVIIIPRLCVVFCKRRIACIIARNVRKTVTPDTSEKLVACLRGLGTGTYDTRRFRRHGPSGTWRAGVRHEKGFTRRIDGHGQKGCNKHEYNQHNWYSLSSPVLSPLRTNTHATSTSSSSRVLRGQFFVSNSETRASRYAHAYEHAPHTFTVFQDLARLLAETKIEGPLRVEKSRNSCRVAMGLWLYWE